MAFTGKTEGVTYAPGYFLANNEDCTRLTKNFKASENGTNITVKDGPNGSKYVPMGSVYKESESPIGIVYEDVDVTLGEAAGSVVTAGTVYKDRLLADDQETAASIDTITLIDEAPKVTRPTYTE